MGYSAGVIPRIEKQLNKLPGVEAAVNFAAKRAHIRFAPHLADAEQLPATVAKTGFTAIGTPTLSELLPAKVGGGVARASHTFRAVQSRVFSTPGARG